MSSKKPSQYSMEFKKEVVEYAAKTNNSVAAKHYGVHRTCVWDWRRIETRIDEEIKRNGGKTTRFKLGGGKLKNADLEEKLAKWVRDKREKNQRVPRRIVLEQARVIKGDFNFKPGLGWFQGFTKRHNLVTRKSQKPLEKYNDDFLFDTLNKEGYFGEEREDIQQLEQFGMQAAKRYGVHKTSVGQWKMIETRIDEEICHCATMSSKKQRPEYSMEFKKEVAEFAAKTNNSVAAKHYGVHKTSVRQWRKIETLIDEEIKRNGGKKTRLGGGGRKLKDADFEENLAERVPDNREKNQRVPRKSVQEQTCVIWEDFDFKSSDEWLQRFMQRHNLETRKSQKPLEEYNDDFLFDTLNKDGYFREEREDIQQLEQFGMQHQLFLGAHEVEH